MDHRGRNAGVNMSEITTIIVAVLGSGAISAVVNLVCRLIEKSIERKSGTNESMRLLLNVFFSQKWENLSRKKSSHVDPSA